MTTEQEYVNSLKEQYDGIDKSLLDLKSQILVWQDEAKNKEEILKKLDISVSPPIQRFGEFIINPLRLEIDDLQRKIGDNSSKIGELTQRKVCLGLAITRLRH
jgi:hypothetical protein